MNSIKFLYSFTIFFFLGTWQVQAEIFDPNKPMQPVDSLKEYEQLAYKMVGGMKNTLQLYAQEISNQENLRLIGEWNPVSEYQSVQFTNNRRNCFFVIQRAYPYSSQGSLLQYIGDTGEIEYIIDITLPFSISRDGKFIVLNLMRMYNWKYDIGHRHGRFIGAVWSIETRQLLFIFDWTVKKNWGGDFSILMDKNDNFINIYHILEGGYLPAYAVINLDTMLFEVIYDITDEIIWTDIDWVQSKMPTIYINEYPYDDMINKFNDNTLRLVD